MLMFKSQVEAGLRDQMADEVTLDLFHCMCLSYLEDLLKVEHQKLKVCAFQEELLLEEQQERDLAIEKAKEKAERKRLKKQRQKNKVNESLITQNLQSESHSTHQQHGACNLSHQGDSGNQHKEFNLKMHNCEESMNNNKTKGQKESQQKRNQKSKGRQGQGQKLDSQNCNKNDGPRQNGKSKQQCSEEVEHDVKSNDSVADSVTELYALNGAQEVQCVSQTHQAENVVTNNFDDLCPILDHSIIMAAVNMEDSDEIYEEYADYKDPDEEQYDRYVLISDEDYEDEEEAVARIDQVSKDSAEDFEVIHSHNHSKTKGCSSSTDVYEYQYRSYPNKHTPSRTTLTPSSTPPRQHPHRDACHLHNHHQNQQVQQKFSQVQSQFQGVKWPRMPAINQSQKVMQFTKVVDIENQYIVYTTFVHMTLKLRPLYKLSSRSQLYVLINQIYIQTHVRYLKNAQQKPVLVFANQLVPSSFNQQHSRNQITTKKQCYYYQYQQKRTKPKNMIQVCQHFPLSTFTNYKIKKLNIHNNIYYILHELTLIKTSEQILWWHVNDPCHQHDKMTLIKIALFFDNCLSQTKNRQVTDYT
eukprot:TRINITY_DN9082_c0_g1_i1.p1 TRINITY_DN9082_c0_g1~~TRINITY_DN9082_c0_g1_i1.p1  ORF type:complete len:584 (+),score=43.65 TRINITY_DN9082_c0_g1_i1:3-1754(+)